MFRKILLVLLCLALLTVTACAPAAQPVVSPSAEAEATPAPSAETAAAPDESAEPAPTAETGSGDQALLSDVLMQTENFSVLLMQNLMKNQNKKNEEKAQELKEFISRFSANKSKSKQATARRKLLEKSTREESPASSRRYPWVAFSPDREVCKDILFVSDVS